MKMNRKPKPRASATPAPSITVQDVLMRARRLAFALAGAGHRLDPVAREAINSGRHGAAGEAFAAGVLAAVAAGADLDGAIVAALRRAGGV